MIPCNGLGFAAVALAGLCSVAIAAQDRNHDFPKRPIRVVIGIAPGGALDTMARLAARGLHDRLGQSVIVDNRPGGGTVLGMDIVAHAQPDGYTLLGASDSLMLNGVFRRASYDVRKAFIPIAQLTTQPYVLVVHPGVPAKSVKELIAYAKSKPGALSYGSQGMGTNGHIGWERFKHLTGIDIVHVPYKGAAPAILDVMAGQIHAAFSNTVTSGVHLKSGKLRGLAITGTQRGSMFPEMPTVAEAGVPGFHLTNTDAYFAVAGTPMAIVRKLNAALVQAMNTPEARSAVAADGSELAPPTTPAQFRLKFDREYAELEKLIKTVNLTLK